MSITFISFIAYISNLYSQLKKVFDREYSLRLVREEIIFERNIYDCNKEKILFVYRLLETRELATKDDMEQTANLVL